MYTADYGVRSDGRKMLYSNVLIKRVSADTAAGTLLVRFLYDDREYCSILYEDVFYSQIDEQSTGVMISLAEQTTFRGYRQTGRRDSLAALDAECGTGGEAFQDELAARGYKLYVHYVGRALELLIVAKRVTIEPA